MSQLTALLSVSDKTGIVEFAQALHGLGVQLLSTGGTAKLLAEAGLPVTEVAQHTGFPEMLDGRVKTLHPMIHGGLLARGDLPEHVAAMQQHGIRRIDILAVNLYPFEATVAKPGCTLEDAIENIDIGGPAMVRSAAKNWGDVTVLTDASQYAGVLKELKASGKTSDKTRFACSVAAFNRIAQYDGAISDYLSSVTFDEAKLSETYVPERTQFPGQSNGAFIKVQDLRYGENSHQQAALYRDLHPAPGSLVTGVQLQGKELSYNNINDTDAAFELVSEFDAPSVAIIKHANPCGVAVGESLLDALADASPQSDVVLIHAPANELVRIFSQRARASNLRPLLFCNDLAEGLTDAYTAIKTITQRGHWMAYDLIVCASARSQQADEVGRRLAQCADNFLGAAQRRCLRLDPHESAIVDPNPEFMELAAGLLQCAWVQTLGDTAFDHLVSPGAALPSRAAPVLN